MNVIPFTPKPTSSSTAMPGCMKPLSRKPSLHLEKKPMPETLRVALDERSYDIVVGERLLAEAASYIAPLIKSKSVVIVSDETVAKLYLHRLTHALEEGGI